MKLSFCFTIFTFIHASRSRSRSRSHRRLLSLRTLSLSSTDSSSSLFDFRSASSGHHHRSFHHEPTSSMEHFEELADGFDDLLGEIDRVRAEIGDLDAELVNLMLDNLAWNCAASDTNDHECDLRERLEHKNNHYKRLVAKKDKIRSLLRRRLKGHHRPFNEYYERLEDGLRWKLSHLIEEGKYEEIQDHRFLVEKMVFYRALIRSVSRRI